MAQFLFYRTGHLSFSREYFFEAEPSAIFESAETEETNGNTERNDSADGENRNTDKSFGYRKIADGVTEHEGDGCGKGEEGEELHKRAVWG